MRPDREDRNPAVMPGGRFKAPVLVIRPATGWGMVNVREAWSRREMLYFLIWRDIKVRYKQTFFGVAWAILQPVVSVLIFTVVFGVFAQIPTDGVPYILFAYSGMLPWQLFSYSLTESTNSVVMNQQIIKKIYFPRVFLPLAPIIEGIVDFALAFPVLLGLILYFGFPINGRLLLVIPLVGLAAVTAFAVGLWLSALNVRYRDIRYTVPFLVQVWFFATPIVYSSTVIPERYRAFWSLNPMVGVVESFRWVLLGLRPASLMPMVISGLVVLLLLFGGLVYFRRVEWTMADRV